MVKIKQLALSLWGAIRTAFALLLEITFMNPWNMRKGTWMPPREVQQYDIDETTGFLPHEPLRVLPTEFKRWEDALLEAQAEMSLGIDDSPSSRDKRTAGAQWRDRVRMWPVLDTDCLAGDLRLLQRAHLILAFLVHFFVHSQPRGEAGPSVLVPRSLTVPLTAVSRKLGIAPILTFADVVLWNWTVIDGSRSLSVGNIRHVNLFSGKEDERSFYAKCAAIEFEAARALKIINNYCRMEEVDSPGAIGDIGEDLERLAEIVKGLTRVLGSMRAVVDPYTYYHEVRHWWKGSGSEGQGSPPWLYEGVADNDVLDLSGPSAGQSPIMHAIDIFLDVDHMLAETRLPVPSGRDKRADVGFMERMRRYMQGKHRDYLESLARMPHDIRVRQVAARHPEKLQDAYNQAVLALKEFRDAHLRIACLYIISMSNSNRVAASEVPNKTSSGPARGTGGMEVSTLLKATRNATSRALLPTTNTHIDNRGEEQGRFSKE